MDQVRQNINAGTNFLLILPNTKEAVDHFCKLFGFENGCVPKTLSRSDFFLLSQFVDSDDFDEILRQWDDEHQIVFVEQIDFPVNRPPRLGNYIVYSSIFGIVSDNNDLREARKALNRYENTEHFHPGSRRAAIYEWQGRKWAMVDD